LLLLVLSGQLVRDEDAPFSVAVARPDAPLKLAPVRLAPVRLAPARSTPVSVAPRRLSLLMFLPVGLRIDCGDVWDCVLETVFPDLIAYVGITRNARSRASS
jgi:hypothetical protein